MKGLFEQAGSLEDASAVDSGMDVCEDRDKGAFPATASPGEGDDGQVAAHGPATPGPGPEPEPEPDPKCGPTCVSMKSDCSTNRLFNFKSGQQSPGRRIHPKHSDDSEVSHLSMNDGSISFHLDFKQAPDPDQKFGSSYLPSGSSAQKRQAQLKSILRQLEENMSRFLRNEMKRVHVVLSSNFSECLDEEELVSGEEEKEQQRNSRAAFMNLTLSFLRGMKQEELADCLQSRVSAAKCRRKLKSNLQKRFQHVFEGIAKAGNPTLLNQIYTELYITEGGAANVNQEHEVQQIVTASRKPTDEEPTIQPKDIFQVPTGRHGPIRTVVTKGVAGIGKTVLTQKFTLDWAEDKANQDVKFIFPFAFRELNLLKKNLSLVELVHHFFSETKEAGIRSFEDFQVVFILDGLDECRLPLNFHHNKTLTDVTESTSLDVLLTNLIRGNLLPSARLWITTRAAAANRIPPQCVGMVTEVRGFSAPQKDEYFKKRFRDEEKARAIISHIKSSQSLHIMCHIPVFCWITATVLEDVLKTKQRDVLPKTLTEMYIHFLVVQSKLKRVKYDGMAETDPHWDQGNKKMIVSLGKLAFEQLQKSNLIFYESDLTECGIDITAASVCSGVFTQIFKEEKGLYQEKVYCFIHLSVQEFLAALHVHQTFIDSGINLLTDKQTSRISKTLRLNLNHLYETAVDEASKCPNGQLDLFLRFLLGLSLKTNQTLLRGLLTPSGNHSKTNQTMIEYIKKKIGENLSQERSINLFHCLNELNDHSLVEEIQQHLRSRSTDELSPAQWSALVFMLLSSAEDLDVFDLKKYSASEKALLRLLPVVKSSTKALLSGCNLTKTICKALSSVLSSKSSSLRELDLSNNNLSDGGVELLAEGLKNPDCQLRALRLSGCLITKEGCNSLASALSSNPSHLKELDLSYNHPEDFGIEMLAIKMQDPRCRLDTLRVDNVGAQRLKRGLRKYACELIVDANTMNRRLQMDDRKVVQVKREQPYPDHPDRFEHWHQLLCTEPLTGRCYFEVEWSGFVRIAVTYKEIVRTGSTDESVFGCNDKSWSLKCSDDDGFSVRNNNVETHAPSCSISHRVAVYVDCDAGTLSFYRVSPDPDILIHLHTFNTTFSQPLYPGFGFWKWCGSSVSLCSLP